MSRRCAEHFLFTDWLTGAFDFITSANTTANKDFNTRNREQIAKRKKKHAQQISKTIRDVYTARTIKNNLTV